MLDLRELATGMQSCGVKQCARSVIDRVAHNACALQQYTFEWRSPQSGPLATAAVLVATSFNQWKPFPLFQQDDGGWARRVMVPHGRFTFLFEVDGVTRVSENEMYEPTASKSRHLSEVSVSVATF
jgi:hypothetical protein